MIQEPQCREAEEETLAEWRANGTIEIIDDVDRDAFRALAEPYLREHFTPEQVVVLDAIRSVAN
jgi:hypothetical protein